MGKVTLFPESDISTGGWTTTPLFSKIDEDNTVPDGVFISTTAKNDTFKCELTGTPAETGIITKITMRWRARGTPVDLHRLQLSVTSADEATLFVDFETTFLKTIFEDSLAIFDLNTPRTKAEMDGARLIVKSSDPAMANPGDWDIDYINVDCKYLPAVIPDSWHPGIDEPLIVVPSMISSGNIKGYSV